MNFSFFDDAPKENPWEEDRLDFAHFAKRLAETIMTMTAPNGYVIGLHGAWGTGKSTAIRFVRAFINKHLEEEDEKARRLLIVEFKPWMVSGHSDLVSAFFKVLSEALTPKRNSRWREAGRRAMRWIRLTSDPVVDAAAKVAIAAHPVAAPAVGAGAGVFKTLFGSAIDRWLAEPSLQSAYDELAKKLRSTGRNILVIVDDIDRLRQDEIRSMLQMVKTVGGLPNVIYLLAYDRAIVGPALDGDWSANTGRPGFAEKIVQHELELPSPSKDALLKLLDSEIDFLSIEAEDSMRRYELVNAGIRRWISSPRDIGRLVNGLQFAWLNIRGEIDPFDFLCVECIRLFEQPLFAWVRDNQEFLVGGSLRFTIDDERKALMASLKDQSPLKTRDDSFKVLAALFPNRAKDFLGKDAFGAEVWRATQLRRAIAFEPSYRAYFRSYPQPDAISKELVDKAVAGLDDYEVQLSILDRLVCDEKHSASLAKQYFVELRYRLFESQKPMRPTQELLHAIFHVGDRVLGLRLIPEGTLEFPPITYLGGLLKEMFRSWQAEASGEALARSFEKADTIAFCAMIFVDLGRRRGAIEGQSSTSAEPIPAMSFEALGVRMLAMIRHGNATKRINDAPYYFDIARAWAYLADENEPNAWLSAGMRSNGTFLARVAYGLLTRSTSSAGSIWELRDRALEPWYDRDAMIEGCNKFMADKELSADERARIRALSSGLTKERDAAS